MAKGKTPARKPRSEPGGGEGDLLAPARAAAPARPEFPTDFSTLLGQDRAVGLLAAAIKSDRVHHAWIFHGPPGIGKLTAARAFASLLLLPRDKSGRVPAEFQHLQHLLRVGGHPDVHVVTKELAAMSRETRIRKHKQTNISKFVLDEFFIEPLGVARTISAPSVAGKVFIIDEAELLDPVGQNTILKVVEEPPPGAIIIFVTSDLFRLLPTIRSRCQIVGFAALDDKTMQQWVNNAGLNVPAAELQWLTTYAAGSPGSLLTAAQRGLSAWHKRLEPMLAALERRNGSSPSLGPTLASLVDERAAEAVKENAEASKEAANRLWSKRLLGFLAERTRRALNASAAAGEPADRPLAWLELFSAAERQINANVAYATVFENLAAQMATEQVVAA
ncbi:MAG: ATP-binding protein [Phycisphaerales bacterium]